jgi:hypothetical protein
MGQDGNRVTQSGVLPPDISAVMARANTALDKVRVVHGANERYFDQLAGKSVANIRKLLREAFNIPGDAVALIDGKEVGDEFILNGGQSLEFIKSAGEKG